MVQSRTTFLPTFAEQVKQILIIHAEEAESEVLTVALGVSVMLTETEIELMMSDFSSWTRGGTYSGTEKTLTGYISNQETIGSAAITVTINALVDPTEIAASPEFNTSYTAGEGEDEDYKPFQSLTYKEFFAIYGYYPIPTNDNFAGYTSSTTTTTHTTTTTTAAPTTTTTTA